MILLPTSPEDMVTLAGVLTAYTSASQWRRALHVPREMQQTADAVLYSRESWGPV